MLYHDFLTNREQQIYKWVHYFPIYERHLAKFVNQSCVVWEIGVFEGGTTQMLKRYLGPFAQIVGIDINPECKKCEDAQIEIFIGDQSDTAFLQTILDKHGSPDIVIDDGSHIMEHLYKTFNFLYDKLSRNGVYIVEDVHTSYMEEFGGGFKREGSFIEHSKDLVDHINARYNDLPKGFAKSTFCMSFYDSVVVFEKIKWMKDSLKSLKIPRNMKILSEKMNKHNYDKIIFYGFGRNLKENYTYTEYDFNIEPDEIWDIRAKIITAKEKEELCLQDKEIKEPYYNMDIDKNKVAIVITLGNKVECDKIKEQLNQQGFNNIFYLSN